MRTLGVILILTGIAAGFLYCHYFSLWELVRATLTSVAIVALMLSGASIWEAASAAGVWNEPQDDDSKDLEDS